MKVAAQNPHPVPLRIQETRAVCDILPRVLRLVLQKDPLRGNPPSQEIIPHRLRLGAGLILSSPAGDDAEGLRIFRKIGEGPVQTKAKHRGGAGRADLRAENHEIVQLLLPPGEKFCPDQAPAYEEKEEPRKNPQKAGPAKKRKAAPDTMADQLLQKEECDREEEPEKVKAAPRGGEKDEPAIEKGKKR